MSFQIADDTCKWLLSNSNTPQIFFFGGEPTLRWDDIIVPLVEKYPEIEYSITTNGFVLDK
jgi:sulfatase maturation enzyme AslB (radical SAM superfamily)